VEPLDDAVGLRASRLGAAVVDVLDREVEFVFVGLGGAAVFGAAVGQHPAQLEFLLVEEGHDAIVEQIGRGDRGLAVIKLGEAELAVGVDEGLLVDAPDTLQRADIEGVLRAAIAWAFALEFAVRLLVQFGSFKSRDLRFGEHQAILGALGLEGLEPLVHGLEVVALPDAADAGGGDGHAALPEFVGDPHLAERRLLDGEFDDSLFDRRLDAVLQHRLAPGHFRQRDFAAFLVEFLEAVEAVAAVAHDLAGLGDIAQLPAQLQQPDLGPDHLAFCRHRVGSLDGAREGTHPLPWPVARTIQA